MLASAEDRDRVRCHHISSFLRQQSWDNYHHNESTQAGRFRARVLREAGKVSRPSLPKFLRTHYASIPRTTLRYAIEPFSPEQRERMLAGNSKRDGTAL